MDVTGNPWIIDAADVAGLAAISGNGNVPGDVISVLGVFYKVIWRGAAHVYQVEFMDYASDADACQISRYNTKDFWDTNGASDLSTVRSGNVGWTNNGIVVANNAITDGRVKIYIK